MRRNSEAGMTLMELLVALVIGALVITLVVRGLGLTLNVYERVSRWTDVLDVRFRESRWWNDAVGSLIACTDPAHCLTGSSTEWRGYTLAGVTTQAGQRLPVRWVLEPAPGGRVLVLYEGAGLTQRTVMHASLPNSARFAYLGPDGQWYQDWNASGNVRLLPSAIRISEGDRVWAYAAIRARTLSRPDYRDGLGGGL